MCRNKISSHLIDHVMRQISSTILLERHIRVPKQSYIDFGDNYIFGELVYRRVGLLASWSVGELSTYRSVGRTTFLRSSFMRSSVTGHGTALTGVTIYHCYSFVLIVVIVISGWGGAPPQK